eukprot:CAMPEP_0113919178 /NCGR_PEP_ID=MMETSP0780_2-20120614/33772_1 /TAXON_ID=652834 /ORGANISM="Palpitomonas bilix" /LENGTH=175 /DNA_ID=CAMNT_0000919087 /DNA_START=97 /DNA_END=624 /DNA_ORIENTATION=+ /assembly_acc=CAM_ASM_000599
MDVYKLCMSEHKVDMLEDSMCSFYVWFHGPADSPYEGGVWKVYVELPPEYPYKSPSIGFKNKIFHPNVDEASGSVCLDVLNQTWSPMFDLTNIFDSFLPQLLLYPNPSDPLNGEAASLMLRDHNEYVKKIRDMVKQYATEEALEDLDGEEKEMEEDHHSVSSGSEISQMSEEEEP